MTSLDYRRCPLVTASLITAMAVGHGCGSSAPHGTTRVAPPAWFPSGDAARFDSERFIVGVGACGTEVAATTRSACAAQRAAEQVALRVRATVTAERERHTIQTTQREGASRDTTQTAHYEQRGTAETTLELPHLQPREEQCQPDGPCWALIAVERAELVAQARRRIDADLDALDGLLASLETADIVSRLERLAAAHQRATTIDGQRELIAAVAGRAGVSESPSMPRVAAARKSALAGSTLCLASTATELAPAVVYAAARTSLASLGFGDVAFAAAPDCRHATLWVRFDGRLDSHPSSGGSALTVVDLSGQLSLGVADRTIGATRTVKGRGVASSSIRARVEAEAELATSVASALTAALGVAGW